MDAICEVKIMEECFSLEEKIRQQYCLTKREWEIAVLAAARLTNAEIAKRIYLAEATVKNHMHRIFEKMQIAGTARNKRILLAELLQMK